MLFYLSIQLLQQLSTSTHTNFRVALSHARLHSIPTTFKFLETVLNRTGVLVEPWSKSGFDTSALSMLILERSKEGALAVLF